MADPHGSPPPRPVPPSSLLEIGLTPSEAKTLLGLAAKPQGFIIFTGPHGSGKSHTANALLADVANRERSLVSIEDPIKFALPSGRQMEVNEATGDTQELLFLDLVEENPEVFFLGEIKEKVGARMCVKYAGKGHQALATLASSNTTTALFRLERFGIPRAAIGETLSCVVAQRRFPCLCPACKEPRPLSKEEKDRLAPFTSAFPEHTAHPTGCLDCGHTGYKGERPIIEILEIGPELADLIADGVPISTLRRTVRSQGVPLLTAGGLRGVSEGEFNLQDLYVGLFLEELDRDMAAGIESGRPFDAGKDSTAGPGIPEAAVEGADQTSVLVVEDEPETRYLVEQILSGAGYRVSVAVDGAEALLKLATEPVDLILSDIHMPNLNGLKLLELVQQHGIEAPVVFLTGDKTEEVERQSYEMGAIDFLRKPVDKDVLLESLDIAFAVLSD